MFLCIDGVSVLFNESKLLKSACAVDAHSVGHGFSTLQRVEIAEIGMIRAEYFVITSFSTLQRVEIAEMLRTPSQARYLRDVSVLFNESKLLKYKGSPVRAQISRSFSTLQRVEIAEI